MPEGGTPMKRVKVGVIGCGFIGQNVHIPNYIRNSKSRLVAICDTDKHMLNKIVNKYQIDYTFTDYMELLESNIVDAVSVCVPTRMHSRIVIDTAKHGIHVLCEKPLASNLKEADEMLRVVENSGVKLAVGFNLRYLHNHLKVIEYLKKGKIGKPIFVRAQLITAGPYEHESNNYTEETEERIGCLFDSGAHLADLMYWMFGRPSEISAYLSTHMNRVDVDDSALVSVRFESGVLGALYVAWAKMHNYFALQADRQIEIVGSKGILESDIFGPSLRFYGAGSLICKLKGKVEITPKKFDPRIPNEALNWSYEQEIDDFLESIVNNRPPMVSGEEAKESLRFVLAAYKSFQSRSKISQS